MMKSALQGSFLWAFAVLGLACGGGSAGDTSGVGGGAGNGTSSSGSGATSSSSGAASSSSASSTGASSSGSTSVGGTVTLVVDGVTNDAKYVVYLTGPYEGVVATFPGMPDNKGLTMSFAMKATGTYTCAGDGPYTGITYTDGAGSSFGATHTLGSCTVEVTEYGAVGGTIAGTFSGMLSKGAGPGSSMLSVTGTFSVTRSK